LATARDYHKNEERSFERFAKQRIEENRLMTRAMHSPLYVTKELFETRYQGAEAIFVAGSVVRGEASTYSDLDLVVIYPKVPVAYRESFFHKDWPVEAFIHDRETIQYFFKVVDPAIGRATLAEMVSEGHEIPGPSVTTTFLKDLARVTLQAGPPALPESEIQDRRYQISELIDDIREPRSKQELIATASLVYNELADFYFRVQRGWTGSGKSVLKRMKRLDPIFTRRFSDAFDELFSLGQTQKVIEVAEEVLGAAGGFLFEGYRRDVPLEWRPK
jgi:predicted nucleotidyltransferase